MGQRPGREVGLVRVRGKQHHQRGGIEECPRCTLEQHFEQRKLRRVRVVGHEQVNALADDVLDPLADLIFVTKCDNLLEH